MTYFPQTHVDFADTADTDAFGRLRVAAPFTLFDSKQIHDDRTIYWDAQFTLNATSSYVQSRASTTLTVSSTSGSKAVRQSKTRANYQTGKSMLVITTQVFGSGTTGIVKRVGLFDERNGVCLQQNGSNVSLLMRSYVTGAANDTVVPQASWNVDTMDGNGPSGVVLDITKAQILLIDLQWLGVGRVRVGFEINGQSYYVHNFLCANIKSSVYMSTPNLPVRYEIENTVGTVTGSLEQICSTIISEGGFEPKDQQFSVNRGVTPVSGVSNAGLVPLVSIRLNPAYTGSYVVPVSANVVCTTNLDNPAFWAVVLNPTVAGTNQPVWRNVLSSSVQYDTNRNSTNTVTNGLTLASGYIQTSTGAQDIKIDSLVNLGSTIAGVTDELALCVQNIAGANESYVGSLTWRGAT